MPKQSLNEEFVCTQELNILWQSCQDNLNNSLLLREDVVLYRATLIEKIKHFFHVDRQVKQFDPVSMSIDPSVFHNFIEHFEYHLGEFSRFFTKILLENDGYQFGEFDLSDGAPTSILMDWTYHLYKSHLQQCVLAETEFVAISYDQSEESYDVTSTFSDMQWKRCIQAEKAIVERLSRLVSISIDNSQQGPLHASLNRLSHLEQYLSMKSNQVNRELEQTIDMLEKKLSEVKNQAKSWEDCTQKMNEWSSQYMSNSKTISRDLIIQPALSILPRQICIRHYHHVCPEAKENIALKTSESIDVSNLCILYREQSEQIINRCLVLEEKIHETNKIFYAVSHVEQELNVYYKKLANTIIDIEPMVHEWMNWQGKMIERSKASQPIQSSCIKNAAFDSRFFSHSAHRHMTYPDIPRTFEVVFPKFPGSPVLIQPQLNEKKHPNENGERKYAQYL